MSSLMADYKSPWTAMGGWKRSVSFAQCLITTAVVGMMQEEEDESSLVYVKGHEKREWLTDILDDVGFIIDTLDADYEDIDASNNLDVTNSMRCGKHVKNCALQNI
ncbi:hypothetical protein RF55_23411 [Lasius niger]|uniref:Uncharacterized protein n=1 Tax=Lasius niger TaxID=67767 RepID=A0A0J7JVN9_LASNI|nr:hypothetical protein RF55_23411 [Lasius niger]